MVTVQPCSDSFSPFDGWSYILLLGFSLGDGASRRPAARISSESSSTGCNPT